jgi:two-component system phosphate regulon sensor histidine kinase PhoR
MDKCSVRPILQQMPITKGTKFVIPFALDGNKMKNRPDAQSLFVALPAVLVTVLALAWAVAPHLIGESWMARAALSAGCIAVCGVAASYVVTERARERSLLQHCVDELCRAEGQAARDEALRLSLQSMAQHSPWRDALNRVAEGIVSYRQRLEEAEQGRASAEIRARRMAAEHEHLSQVLAGLSEPVLAIDHFDELLLANPSAEKLFHFDGQHAERRALQELLRCEELVKLLTDTRRRRTPGQRCGEITVADSSGETRYYRVACRSIATNAQSAAAGSQTQGAVAVLTDISDQKAIQRRNAEFVSAASHEMKTPLAGIKAYVELLADGEAEDEQTREEFLQVINGQTDRLQRLIDNLLNLARIEAGVVEVNKQPRPLNELLEEAAGVVQPAAQQKQIQLVCDLSPMYLEALIDRDMMLQAAINLLSNAVKYTPDGGKVTLRSRITDNEVMFEVEDTGVGISPDDCKKVFERFYRVKKDRQMAIGTGLGLPLAKHIIEDVHSGQLTVASELNKGSTFRVALPRMKRRES